LGGELLIGSPTGCWSLLRRKGAVGGVFREPKCHAGRRVSCQLLAARVGSCQLAAAQQQRQRPAACSLCDLRCISSLLLLILVLSRVWKSISTTATMTP
jgi:hypothetical protein